MPLINDWKNDFANHLTSGNSVQKIKARYYNHKTGSYFPTWEQARNSFINTVLIVNTLICGTGLDNVDMNEYKIRFSKNGTITTLTAINS